MIKDFDKFALSNGISSLKLHDYTNSININPQQPVVLEQGKLNMTAVDIFSRLMADRIIYLGREIDDDTANVITAQLLYLNDVNPEKPIKLYINSPGGSVTAGLGIYDIMQLVVPEVHTTCIGLAASMASILLTAGEPGYRGMLKHSRVMIHQPMCGAFGQASDIAITAREIQFYKKELYNILSEHTGQTIKTITKDADRDFWMGPQEAINYGLIDNILPLSK